MEPTESETKLRFPKGFLLGAATSAHQVEGNNTNSDWWAWEQQGKLPKSGAACDSYNRFEEDFGLAQQIGLNAQRISIEWARIEPSPGKWSPTAVEHYKQVLLSLKQHGLVRAVTLWHWTLPKWAADQGGFENHEVVESFARYAWFIAQNLGEEIDLWLTLNEPELYALRSYKYGEFPPFINSTTLMIRVNNNLAQAHQMAYRAIKSVRKDAKIGVAKNSPDLQPFRAGHILDRLTCWLVDRLNFRFLNKIQSDLDFIGLNYYTFISVKFSWRHGYLDMNHNNYSSTDLVSHDPDRSDMGWLLYPQGIYDVLKKLKKFDKPIYVTESGIADGSDTKRYSYIRTTLQSIRQAMHEGVDVKGFFYWSLLDNFEWTSGFGPRFGLIEMNYETQGRKVRPSTRIFKEINLE